MRPTFAPMQLLRPLTKSHTPSWADKLTVGAIERPKNLGWMPKWLARYSRAERAEASHGRSDQAPQNMGGAALGRKGHITVGSYSTRNIVVIELER
jgi:hypothetical protein